jgi:hypothetical protein
LLNAMGNYTFRNMDDCINELYNWYLERKDSIDKKLLSFDK